MNRLGLVLYLPADQQFTEQVSTLLTTTTYVQSEVKAGAIPLFQAGRSPAHRPPVAAVPWCMGLQVTFQVTFPTEYYEQAMREWDEAARTFAFHPALAELLWRRPYYHVELQTVDIPRSDKSFRKPWESGGYYFQTFTMSESSYGFQESVLAPYPLGEQEELIIVPLYSPKPVEDALFHMWREFASTFHLFLIEANLAKDDDNITGDFDLAYRQASVVASALYHPLRRAREEKQCSMRELAERVGLGKNGQNRINEWEHGKHVPTLIFANALARELGFPSGAQVRQICQDWQREHLQTAEED